MKNTFIILAFTLIGMIVFASIKDVKKEGVLFCFSSLSNLILLMKNTTLITILFCLLTTYGFAQKMFNYNTIAQYSFSKKLGKTDTVNTTLEDFTLYSNDKASFFISSNRINLDTLMQNATLADISKFLAMPRSSSDRRILKQKGKEYLIIYNAFYDKTYRYKDNVHLDWKILNEYDTLTL